MNGAGRSLQGRTLLSTRYNSVYVFFRFGHAIGLQSRQQMLGLSGANAHGRKFAYQITGAHDIALA